MRGYAFKQIDNAYEIKASLGILIINLENQIIEVL